ncbi:UDP-glucose 4-epimerase [Lobosporangium transversale]|uniref:UDP-glucose 4-epimerase n=1 Tax=Lobosporangium transversale TaxID=64571 RepID=A0A1Y2GVE4_9FUNG|nr:UDP-glucose 4-epimerase [Lobosporangium transversale]ORZ22674.1 UDP-glucose 4-epimerase [Lobosporangium transversale]|eukprot:XP_021883228.1 UDP-glucose 4-epimerase [Lobosporangium transversale]
MTIPPHLHKDVHQEKEVKKESVTKKDGYKDQKETILVTGGAGYIGSHTVVQLLNLGKHLVIVDSLCNSSEESLRRVQSLAKANNYKGSFNFHKVDILDIDALEKVFDRYTFSACIHLAGLKAVGESSEAPLSYYHTNITGTLNLIQLLQKHQCRNFIFSSSATVYGLPTSSRPIQEDAPLGAMNPYGRTKQYIEEILRDTAASEPGQWNIILLRYFNPVGAHESGVIGEDPNGTPNNLMPYVAQVAIGRRPVINVFGDNYDTKDGTGVRDYIHIQDLARGHVAALEKIEAIEQSNKNLGCVPYNLGTGVGYSVMEMINSMSEVVGHQLPYKIVERRPGDVGTVIADPSLAAKELNWKAEKTLEDMCRDLWRWQTMNPTGYSESSSPGAWTWASLKQ